MAKVQARVQELEARLRAFLDSSIDAIVQMDYEGKITAWNHRAEELFGWSADEVLGRTIEETIVPAGYRKAHAAGMRRFLDTGQARVLGRLIEISAIDREGREFPVELSISCMAGVGEFNAYIRDISERKRAETEIWNKANLDAVTGLPNRNLFRDRLRQEMMISKRERCSLALLYVDLDRFKDVNDSLGHAQGDVLLIEAARRLREMLRESDTVARLNGDEFTIILRHIEDPADVQMRCQRILDAMARPFRLNDELAYLTSSIGVTFYPEDSEDLDTLLKNADQAMYAAKRQGRNQFHVFTAALQQRVQVRQTMIKDLRTALGEGQFDVHYQPIVTLGDGAFAKAEALIRWNHPTTGMVSPDRFIPIAEDAGLIDEIGDHVFRAVAGKVLQWRDRFDIDLQVSINTSPLQWAGRDSGMDRWLGHLDSLGLPGNAIGVEITEGVLMNASGLFSDRLARFRQSGVQVSLDDFGTGYSSLSYLKMFDIDYLKIDRSFVRNLHEDGNDLALCRAIIAMAHTLGIQVVAEGVETAIQRDLLRHSNCDFAQGYFYSRPLPVAEFEALLANRVRASDPLSTYPGS